MQTNVMKYDDLLVWIAGSFRHGEAVPMPAEYYGPNAGREIVKLNIDLMPSAGKKVVHDGLTWRLVDAESEGRDLYAEWGGEEPVCRMRRYHV